MRRPRPSHVIIAAGLGVLVLGGALELRPLLEASQWQTSPEAARAERNAGAPTPVWLTPTVAVAAAPARQQPRSTAVPPQPTAAPAATEAPRLSQAVALDALIAPAPTATPSTSDLRLASSAFTFDDPPQPGARAHLDLSVHNPTDRDGNPIVVSLPTTWLAGYRLEEVAPSPINGSQSNGALSLTFDGPPTQSAVDVTLRFTTTDEVIDSPTVTVRDDVGRSVGQAHPPTEAPPAAPGPIYSIDIPRLKLHSGVVPVEWEPPLFVVGQLRDSAWVTRGNSVLVGHVRGAAGYNVFLHLDQLEPGDQIIAASRGQTYTFEVTQTQVLPEDDTSPTEATRDARLTLMTCAGDWNPLTQDYSDRLWVTAQPVSEAMSPPLPVRQRQGGDP